ncbi:MAG: hypothetical protein HN712_17350 [Gemmatimonadetes bacterium]|jgi:hypothetical protein|nr:hypothetical protein [Gemmatimonadota bacterium]MBT7862086.1 hypothetical protein [Gemmatimonadota bacterium]
MHWRANRVVMWLWGVALAPVALSAQAPPTAAAFDTPNDAGRSITVTWPRVEGATETTYLVYVAASEEGPYRLATEMAGDGAVLSDNPGAYGRGEEQDATHFVEISDFAIDDGRDSLESDLTYFVRVAARTDGAEARGAITSAMAEANLINWAKLNNFLIGTALSIIIMLSIWLARHKDLYIRRIAGLEAIDEALGRATEMGKAVFFVHGLREMDKISTIAAVNILGRIARKTAEYDTLLKVTSYDPVVMSVSQETVKEAYLEMGRPDAYNEDNIFVAGTDQFSYAAAVEGMMVREKPAAHIMMGYFYAESLLLAETGAMTGAIQIAGTDAFTQLPFFVTTCDYTLMGEELYAASAYLSREPRLLGSLKGQDIGKAFLIVALVLGTILATAGVPFISHALAAH